MAGERYDIAIIGSGPAGLQAAINASIRNKKIIIFGIEELSHKVVKAPKVSNYLGLPLVTGNELKNAFQEHIDEIGIKITYERITNVYAMGEYFALMVNEKMYEATSIIMATGIEYTKPLKGELEFLGKGVGYCATCDAPLYKGKKVAIIGHNMEAVEDAKYVNELAEKVYFVPMFKDKLTLPEDIEIIKDVPVEILGDEYAKGIKFNNSELFVDGIFIMKDSIMPDQLVPGLELEDGHIKVNRNMETNLPGCFAAGDCVGKPYQYIKAAGEGCVASLSAVSYVNNLK
ncbi:NAD(P)/FAD-dependent oxidoreductase [Oceanirhabdus sp. W0125-5]|uniref:NAD(P)/FAD-dependent oxidoreductase n=1 Tax=Oceanirhabdus sp. W0125-5 TaxID=2999116 RepID=UPI0022F2D4F4|nr:NAD(P)/FAD-dependent oxidoreductase [Oceanirhabdus sp. W0125-5]WBW98049.1 NAD(P)/FAD-dependent oxidoreductase [Oceanirhabdus sp. W0125-5]